MLMPLLIRREKCFRTRIKSQKTTKVGMLMPRIVQYRFYAMKKLHVSI